MARLSIKPSLMQMRKPKYITLVAVIILFVYLSKFFLDNKYYKVVPTTQREYLKYQEEQSLVEAMLEEKGQGCEVPNIDPNNNVIAEYEQRRAPRPKCRGLDWVQCHLSECKLRDKLNKKYMKDLECTYQDLIYLTDFKTKLGNPVLVKGNGTYTLNRSDHVFVRCTANNSLLAHPVEWLGFKAGYRNVTIPEVPKGREKYPNILLFAFDSTSRDGFIRKMPKSYKVLVEKHKSVILNKYNIVGDGTVAAVLAFLVGKTELELPEFRKGFEASQNLDDVPFLFKLLKEHGYRTAYHEDSPSLGTFQMRLNGFKRQPTDHYLLPFNRNDKSPGFCLGAKLRYSVMIDLTRQFFKLSGPKFIFTFIADISHDDSVRIRWADDEFSQFLEELLKDGHLKDTAVFVMGDHGPRYATFRATYEGRIEERHPFMSIRLPDNMHSGAENVALTANRDVLTTPFDIHATLLQLCGLDKYRNEYKVPGADLMRGISLLEKIPPSRSCAEAGVLPHWCVCLQWRPLETSDPMYQRVANAFVQYVNQLTEPFRDMCISRSLQSVKWVTMKHNTRAMIAFEKSADTDGYVAKLNSHLVVTQQYYQIQVELGPSAGLYEATAVYSLNTKLLDFHERDVSRINAYGNQSSCILHTHPHLAKYCYCR